MNIEVELWLEISYLVPINIKQLQLLILSRKSVYFQHVFYKSSRIRKSLYKYFKNIVYSNLLKIEKNYPENVNDGFSYS